MRILATCCAALVLLAVAPVSPAARAPRAAETVAVELAVVRASRERVELFGEAAPRFIPPLPVPLALHRGFERPPDRWAPGHRGIDLLSAVGAGVTAPRGGTVSFAGDVAGRGVVTVVHSDGLRSSVEPVAAEVEVGAVVDAGDRLGTLTATTSHCAPSACLHWGVRDAHDYVDPLLLLRDGPTVLLPGP